MIAPQAASACLVLSRCGLIDGSQRQLLHLVSGLDPQTFPLTIALDKSGPLRNELIFRGIEAPVYRMSPWRSVAYFISRYRDACRLLALARARSVKLVHANDVWRAEYARFVARHLHVPYIVHVRGPLTPRDIAKHRLYKADAVIAIAQRYVDDLVATGIDPKRIALIDDAVDLTRFSFAHADPHFLRRRLNAERSLLIGMVGRVSAFKRVREYLDIIAMLPSRIRSSARFVIIGDYDSPAYRREIEGTLARIHQGPQIDFLGRFSEQDMPHIYASLDLLVTLSGGSVMFEAMACGTPVLSVRTDGRHSLHTRHNDTAWCVTTSQPAEAANALVCLVEDASLRRRLGRTGQDWVRQNLSALTMARKTYDLYQRIIAR